MNGKDDDLWAAYGRHVKKIKENKVAPPRGERATAAPPLSTADMPEAWRKVAEKETADSSAEKKEETTLPAPEKAVSLLSPPLPQPLDLRIERNLSLGDVVIEAKLDLHGKTEKEAYEKLLVFIEEQQKRKRRLVLVITGKGRDKAAPLRVNLPRWCGASPLMEKILAVRAAAPHHGGDGAYYVLLRK